MLFILKYVWKQVVTVIKLKCICSHSPLEFGYPPYNTVGQRHTEVRSQALRAPSIAQLRSLGVFDIKYSTLTPRPIHH